MTFPRGVARKAELEFYFVFLGRAPCFKNYVRAKGGHVYFRALIHKGRYFLIEPFFCSGTSELRNKLLTRILKQIFPGHLHLKKSSRSFDYLSSQ